MSRRRQLFAPMQKLCCFLDGGRIHKEGIYSDFRKREIRIRFITEISSENLQYVKELTRRFCQDYSPNLHQKVTKVQDWDYIYQKALYNAHRGKI
jgi:hypothetical protein